VRCAADPTELEVELFGRGGADGARSRAGLLESARGGTVVLEDALSLSAGLRAQLARASATQTSQRVGAKDSHSLDVRLVLTTTVSPSESDAVSLEDLMGCFRALIIDVPPLRERRSDIPQLVQHFRQRLATEQGMDVTPLPPDAMLSLLGREWPGNVRELERWVEGRAPSAGPAPRDVAADGLPVLDLSNAQATLEQLERVYILHVLAFESGHQSRTAVRLGIDRRTLYRKLKQYRREH
jgi:DNA-binding NtrC family response regulator